MKKILLLDGHSLAYRAFYGLPLYDSSGKPRFSNGRGEFTNAIFGFASMLFKVWADEQPDYIAAAFDKGRTFRDDMFAEYKGTRQKMPDELAAQMPRIVQLVEAFGIPAITADGYEADDILGTLAKRAAAEGLDALIVTGDTDAFQLIEPHVKVFTSGRMWNDTTTYDETAVKERYGLDPIQLIDFKALKGDTSDNVPGVKGIGEKTATNLLQEYGSVENVYKHLDAVTPNRAKTALEANREMAFLSKDLVTIRLNVPVKVKWEACAIHEYDRDRVIALFDELDFKTLRNRLPQGGVSAAPIDSSPDQAVTEAAPPATSRKAAKPRQVSMFDDETTAPAEQPKPNKPTFTATTIVQNEAALKSPRRGSQASADHCV